MTEREDCKRYYTSLTKNKDCKNYLDMSLTKFTRENTVNITKESVYLMFPVSLNVKRQLSNVYSVFPRKFGQTHMKVMFTVLNFNQTCIVMFTVL